MRKKIDIKIINKWSGYFHDGQLIDVKQSDHKIEISIESLPIFPKNLEEVESQIKLTNNNRIKGILHLKGVKSILANELSLSEFKMTYDDGEIMNFDLKGNKIKLGVIWENYFPKPPVEDYIFYEIEANEIYWENIPDLHNPSRDW